MGNGDKPDNEGSRLTEGDEKQGAQEGEAFFGSESGSPDSEFV